MLFFVELLIDKSLDILHLLVLDANLKSIFQPDKGIISAGKTYTQRVRDILKKVDEVGCSFFPSLIKRVDVYTYISGLCFFDSRFREIL